MKNGNVTFIHINDDDRKSKQQRNETKRTHCLLDLGLQIFAAVISLAALIIILVLSFTKQNSGNQLMAAGNVNMPCIKCLTSMVKLQDVELVDSQRLPCCPLTSAELYLKLTANQSKKEVKLEPHLPTPVSAHKYLLSSNKAMNFSNVDHVTVQLNTSSNEKNSNNHARGVNIKHDAIEILHSGHYYIYSSLFYLPNTNVSSEHFPYQTWFHYVYRTRPNSPAMSSVILRTVFTCLPNFSQSKDSVHTGGIFHLRAGDLIQVCLSGQGIMGRDLVQDSSFLGLFMLSSDPSV